jgi:hypothetical protein
MKDGILVLGLVLAFAALVTVHVAIVLGLAWRDPRWRAVAAFFVPPLAPYWAVQSGMMIRAAIWIGSVVLYTSLLGISAI